MVGLRFPLPLPYFHAFSIPSRTMYGPSRTLIHNIPVDPSHSAAPAVPSDYSAKFKKRMNLKKNTHTIQSSSRDHQVPSIDPTRSNLDNTSSRFQIQQQATGYRIHQSVLRLYHISLIISSTHQLIKNGSTRQNDLIRPTASSPNLISDAADQPSANSHAVSRCSGWTDTARKGA